MGCCASQPVPPEQREIDKTLTKDKDRDSSISKVLLLGPGESGKSTVFKQFIEIHGKGFSEEDRKGYREACQVNVIQACKLISEYYNAFTEVKELQHTMSETAEAARAAISKAAELTPEVASQVKTFWADEAVQEVFAMGNRYHLSESSEYFINQVDIVARPDYIPTFNDVIRCRIRTTGIVELEFLFEKHVFKLFDMGGQRNERKKWIHCFENVTAVIFVAALASYDQMLIEDDKVNRMHEAINLFDDICNGRWFKRTAMILFLNKRDLFQEKLSRVPLTCCFSDYKGPNEYEPCAEYIQKLFELRNRQKKQVYTHLTCATATDNIKMVFNAIKDIIIRAGLKDIGLV